MIGANFVLFSTYRADDKMGRTMSGDNQAFEIEKEFSAYAALMRQFQNVSIWSST